MKKSALKFSIIILLLLFVDFKMKIVYAIYTSEVEEFTSDNIVSENSEDSDIEDDSEFEEETNEGEMDEGEIDEGEIDEGEIDEGEIDEGEIEQEVEDDRIGYKELDENHKQQDSIVSNDKAENEIPHTGLKETIPFLIGSILSINIIRLIHKLKLIEDIYK